MADCETKIGYRFKSQPLLREALRAQGGSNKRLAIVGDRVVETITAELWYKFAGKSLNGSQWATTTREALCNRSFQATGRSLGLDQCTTPVITSFRTLDFSKKNTNPMADTIEALLGAVWLDSYDRNTMLALITRLGLIHTLMLDPWRPGDLATSMALPYDFFHGNRLAYKRPLFTGLQTELYIYLKSIEPSIRLVRRLHAGDIQIHELKHLTWVDNMATHMRENREDAAHANRHGAGVAQLAERVVVEHGTAGIGARLKTFFWGKEVVSTVSSSKTAVDDWKEHFDEPQPRETGLTRRARKRRRHKENRAKAERQEREEQERNERVKQERKEAPRAAQRQSGDAGMWAGLKTLLLGPEAAKSESAPSVQSSPRTASDATTLPSAEDPEMQPAEPKPKTLSKEARREERKRKRELMLASQQRSREHRSEQRSLAQHRQALVPPERDPLNYWEARLQNLIKEVSQARDANIPFADNQDTNTTAKTSVRGVYAKRL